MSSVRRLVGIKQLNNPLSSSLDDTDKSGHRPVLMILVKAYSGFDVLDKSALALKTHKKP